MGRVESVVFLLGCIASSYSLSEEPEQCVDDGPLFQTRRHVNSQNHRPAEAATHRTAAGLPAVMAGQTLIPPQLIMTGPFASIDDLPKDLKENLENTRSFAEGLNLRYFNDEGCRDYLKEHFGNEFQQIFAEETHGAFRGDICRSAILLREGGFYIDLDFQLHTPLLSLVDEHTTFMSAYADHDVSNNMILNALIAVRPNSPVMKETMTRLRWWYAGTRKGLPGPVAMRESVEEMIRKGCPKVQSAGYGIAQWSCGSENVRLYQEEFFGLGSDCAREGQVVCPTGRANAKYHGAGFGVFSIGDGTRESRLIGWPRFLACSQMGCGMGPYRSPSIPKVPATPPYPLMIPTEKLNGIVDQKKGEEQTAADLAVPSASASIPEVVPSPSSEKGLSKIEKLRRALEIERKEAWQAVQLPALPEAARQEDAGKSSSSEGSKPEVLEYLKKQLEDNRNEEWNAFVKSSKDSL